MDKKRKLVIIGAGVAGMTAGCYAQANGYESEIYEMHNIPGGLCTAWQRRGYTFDGCIHWLVGSKPGTKMHEVWRFTGAITDQPIHHHDEFVRVIGVDGREIVQYTDLDRLEKHLVEVSPADKAVIQEMISAARKLVTLEMPVGKPRDLFGALDGLKMMWDMRPYLGVFGKYSKISIGDYASRFKEPLIQEMLTAILDPRYNMMALLTTMGSLAARDAGWPQGGSLPFARGMEKRYLELCGQIHYKSKVTKILVSDGRATGIELADGQKVAADAVISAADGHSTLYKLLGEQYIPGNIARYYSGDYPTITSMLVYLGVDYDFSDLPHSVMFPLDSPLKIGERVHNHIGLKHYSHDPSISPPGKSVVAMALYSDYDYWDELSKDPEQYTEEKKCIAKRVVEELEKRFPQTAGRIEVIDVATPTTFTRYTGVWQGAYMSWISTAKSGNITTPQRLPDLSNFYMAGLWTMGSAGLPGSSISGRNAVYIMCAQDKKEFVGI